MLPLSPASAPRRAPPPLAHWLPSTAASGEGGHGARRGGSAEAAGVARQRVCPPRRASGLTEADPAGRRGVSPEVASLGGQSSAAGSVKPAEPLELCTRARSCHSSLGVFASTSGDASRRDVNSNKTIKSNKINNSVLSSGVFALELAVRVVHSQQYPESLRGIKVAAQGQLGKQRSKHRARPKGCFRGFALILAFLVCCPFSGRGLSSEIPAEASFPPRGCSGSHTPPPSLPPAPHFPPAQAGPTAPGNTSLSGSTSSSVPQISPALTFSLLGP